MDRLQKKCFMASTGTHALLACILMFGSAFFIQKQKPVDVSEMPKLRMIPGKLVDDLLSGGGGNPNLKITDERIKGETMRPEEVQEPAPPAPQPKQEPTPPAPKKVEPTPPKKAEPVIEKTPPKTDNLKLVPTVRKNGKEPVKVSATDPKDSDITKFLKPASISPAEKLRRQAEAEAKAYAAAETKRRESLGKALDNMKTGLRAGFTDGTVVEVGGPGGEAYANYAQFVKEVYENAWNIPTDFLDQNATTVVTVVIDRSGNVIHASVQTKSGSTTLDRSVQRALDRVKFVAPFPEGAKDEKRTFTIDFNVKGKQLG
jgi:TonB family protein